jgi:hypothetical protein
MITRELILEGHRFKAKQARLERLTLGNFFSSVFKTCARIYGNFAVIANKYSMGTFSAAGVADWLQLVMLYTAMVS